MKQFFATGIDLIEVRRFREFNKNSRFAANTFTKSELSNCFKRANPAASLAARFAAKESVVKCIGNVRYNQIEIRSTKSGKPEVKLLDRNMARMYNLAISLSHSEELAVAVCIAWKVT